MSTLETILSRPRTVLTMMVVMVLAGIFTYITIPKEADPDIDVPVFYVSIPHEGISPEDAVRLLVKPMETELRGLDGLKEIVTIASEGHAGIILEFKIDADHDQASSDVREKVDLAKAKLPADADEPTVNEINFSLFPVIAVVLSGDVPERTLYRHARQLKDQIEAIPSVLEANLAGHREELLEVLIDPTKLESYNITQQQLINAVVRNNKLVAAGFLDTGNGKFNIKVPGLFETARDVYDLPIIVKDDGVVTLKEVAEIRRTFKDRVAYSRFNGKPAIGIQVVKRIGTNIVETNREVRRTVATFTQGWPNAIKIDFALDQSKFIFEVLGSLQSAIMTAIALVMIVVVAALGTRSALMVGLAIPTSFMVGFLLIGLLGMTVNMMLMFGLVLTVGILVDGAIVIVEYADRKVAEGFSRREAYTLAAKRMFWPIVSSTATTLAAFLPMLMWPGVAGKFMSYLPITVIIVLTASLVTAMIFLPVLGGKLGRKKIDEHEIETAKQLSSHSHTGYDKIKGMPGVYLRFLHRIVRYPALVLFTTFALIAGVIYAFGQLSKGVEFFVDTEPEQAILFVSARGNMSAQERLAIVRRVEDQVLQVKGLKAVFTNVGAGSSGPDIGTGAGQDQPLDQIGQMIIELADYNTRRKGKVILEEMRNRASAIPGIVVEVRKREEGPPTGKDVRLQITGPDLATVETVARQVREHIDTKVTGLRDIEDSTPLPGIEWVLDVDRTEAGRFGADVVSVGAMIQLVTNGLLIGTYRPDDAEDEVDIRVRLPRPERTVSQLDRLKVITPAGQVPLSNIIQRKAEPKVSTITRRDGRYSMDVKANTVEGVLADKKVTEIDAWLKAQSWPKNVTFRFRGADEDQKESGVFLMKAMVGALFLMFIILVTQFNSFYQTAITLSTVVLSLIGVLIGMMVTGQTFSIIMTGTGVVALAGIVVNNSIVLIDTFNRFVHDGAPKVDAVLRSAAQRLRPVLLTTITTICGLAPMALQINLDFFTRQVQVGSITSIWWVQLSTAIIFGLGFATLLTLVLTPTLLAMPTVYKQSYLRWRAKRRRRGLEPRIRRTKQPGADETHEGKPGKTAPDSYPEAAE